MSTRSLLFAFLTSMQCECIATAQREALAIIRRGEFDAVIVNFGTSKNLASRLLPKMQRIRPDLMGKMIVITAGAADAPSSGAVEPYALAQVSEKSLFQQLWSNLQPLLVPSGLLGFSPQTGRTGRLLHDSSRLQSPSGTRAALRKPRHLVYKCDDLLIDLLIGPLTRVGRVELVGHVLGDSPGKGQLAKLPVVLVNSRGPLAYASTDKLGEFHMEFDPKDDLAVRIRVGLDAWVETPLKDMNQARKRVSRLGS